MKFMISLFLLSALLSQSVFALIYFEDAVFPELVTNGRPLGMGNAFICKVDDSSSAFYNPAGLGTVRNRHFHLTNFHVETNKGLVRTSTGGTFSDAAGNAFKGFSLEGTRQLLLENRGVFAHNRYNFMPNLLFRYFTVGYMLSNHNRAIIDPGDDALFEFSSRRDHGPYAALNLSLFGGVFKIGGSAVYLNRREIIAEQDKDETVEVQDTDYNKGAAVIYTAGARLTLPIALLPTFAGVIHNANDQEFATTGNVAPRKILRTIDVGFSLTPQIGKRVRIHLEVNYKDIVNAYVTTLQSRKFTAGLEFDFARVMFLRFGYGDGFGTAGIGLRTRRVEFDLSTYSVDTSDSGFRGKEDRRFSLTLSAGI